MVSLVQSLRWQRKSSSLATKVSQLEEIGTVLQALEEIDEALDFHSSWNIIFALSNSDMERTCGSQKLVVHILQATIIEDY